MTKHKKSKDTLYGVNSEISVLFFKYELSNVNYVFKDTLKAYIC